MPRDKTCPRFEECLAGLGETEIDWHCEHCVLIPSCRVDEEDLHSFDVEIVMRALDSPKVRKAIISIFKEARHCASRAQRSS